MSNVAQGLSHENAEKLFSIPVHPVTHIIQYPNGNVRIRYCLRYRGIENKSDDPLIKYAGQYVYAWLSDTRLPQWPYTLPDGWEEVQGWFLNRVQFTCGFSTDEGEYIDLYDATDWYVELMVRQIE